MTLDLLVPHGNEGSDDRDPVKAIGYDRAVGGRVVPAQDSLEYSPATAAVQIRRAALKRMLVAGRVVW